jgi:hypothetical protein
MSDIKIKISNSAFESVDLQVLQDSILNKGSEYWGEDTSVIQYSDNFKSWTMMLIYRENLGFFVWLSSNDVRFEDVYTLVQGNDLKEKVIIKLPDNDWVLFKKNFSSREIVWKVVKKFVENGEMSREANWEIFSPPDE